MLPSFEISPGNDQEDLAEGGEQPNRLFPNSCGALRDAVFPARDRVTLIVQPWSKSGYNIDRGILFDKRAITIEGLQRQNRLDQLDAAPLEQTHRLRILIKNWGDSQELYLPPDMGRRLIYYLRNGPPSDKFDCSALVHFLNGLPYFPGHFDFALWWASPLDSESNLETGQTILINRDHRHCKNPWAHSGIYLAQGLYLSKFGDIGKLMVTTLEEQKKAFQGTAVWILEKRQQPLRGSLS